MKLIVKFFFVSSCRSHCAPYGSIAWPRQSCDTCADSSWSWILCSKSSNFGSDIPVSCATELWYQCTRIYRNPHDSSFLSTKNSYARAPILFFLALLLKQSFFFLLWFILKNCSIFCNTVCVPHGECLICLQKEGALVKQSLLRYEPYQATKINEFLSLCVLGSFAIHNNAIKRALYHSTSTEFCFHI